MFGGMRIGLDQAAKVIELLCEGMSVLGTSRITGVAKRTILDLLLYVGPPLRIVHAGEHQGRVRGRVPD